MRTDFGVRIMANQERDDPDQLLDAALVRYAAAEPRAGLEDRILANLRAEGGRLPGRQWWQWSLAAAVAAVLVVAVALAWRPGKPAHPVAASHSSAETPRMKTAAQAALNADGKQVRQLEHAALHGKTGRRSQTEVVAVAVPKSDQSGLDQSQVGEAKLDQPKLDQFPSQQPLSEQEKFLQSYVERYPEQAALVTRARNEALQQDLEELHILPPGAWATDSEQ